jgi:hypothetical protein
MDNLHVWWNIAQVNYDIWWLVSVSVPLFGRHLLTKEGAKILSVEKKKYLTRTETYQEPFFGQDPVGKVIRYYLLDTLHRVDGPAVIYSNGTKLWYLHGKLNSVNDQPSRITHEKKEWFHNDVLHRIGGPAVVYRKNTRIEWYFQGNLHSQNDQPSVEIKVNGRREWHRHGKLHRIGGPAVIEKDGYQEWHKHGKCYRIQDPNGNQSAVRRRKLNQTIPWWARKRIR